MRLLRKIIPRLLSFLLACFACVPLSNGQSTNYHRLLADSDRPFHLKFHGTLTANDGRPLSESQFLTFSIYSSRRAAIRSAASPVESGTAGIPPEIKEQPATVPAGAQKWIETRLVQPDSEGRYTVILGADNATGLPASLRTAGPVLWVNVTRSGATVATVPVTITPQGIYQDCNTDGTSCQGLAGDTAESQLTQIASGGFVIVLNYSAFWGTASEVLAFASQASNVGVNILWSFDDPDFAQYANKSGSYLISDYGELSATCGCTTNEAFIQYVVNLVKDLPATWGYAIADEAAPSTASNVHNLYKIIHAADPNHPQMANGTWANATEPTLSNIEANLDPFNFADTFQGDYYPVGTGAPVSDESTAAGDVQTIANKYGKASQMVLQAYSWEQEDPAACDGTCDYPTVAQLEGLLDNAAGSMTAPQALLWYDYWDTVNAGQWSNLVTAASPQPLQ
jgi:hypothetical protein